MGRPADGRPHTPTDPDNPIRRLRASLGLSRVEFSRQLGVPYSRVAHAELGYGISLGPTLRTALARLGYDVEALEADFREWRRRRKSLDGAGAR